MTPLTLDLRTHRKRIAGRHAALLGGTTTWSDCLVGLRYLANPRGLVQGSRIAAYEQAFAWVIGTQYAYSFAHGRVGLYGILRGLGIGPKDEVLLQVPTHIVVANAIRYTGARPVYVDCQPDTYNMDLEHAERQITARTKAIVLQHTFGIPADMDAALALAQRHSLDVIEDCVHALGSTYDGRQVGSFGRAAFFSSEETKTISTTMGGMVVTNDPVLAKRIQLFQASCVWPPKWLVTRYVLKLIAYHLLTEPHVHRYTRAAYELLGQRQPLPRPTGQDELQGARPANYERRLSNVQAALGLRQLHRLDANVAHRRAIATTYTTQLGLAGFSVPQPPAKAAPAYVRYPVWVEDRDVALRAAAQHALLGSWFTCVLEEAHSPAYGNYEMGSCPRAEEVVNHLVNLPTHPRVSLQHANEIVAALAR